MSRWAVLSAVAALLVSGCAEPRGFCRSAANARLPACTMTEAEIAALPVIAEWWRPTLAVTLHPLDGPAQREGLRRAVSGHDGMAVAGIAVPDPESGRCDIYVALPPRPSSYEFEAVGHELLHCFSGGFHPDLMTGKPASSHLTPREAAAQRAWFSSSIEDADRQSRWTVSCTFGIGRCPPPARPALATLSVTLHPADSGAPDRAGHAPGQSPHSEGVTVTDLPARRCDIHLATPTTYLGPGMAALGRRLMDCFAPGEPGDSARRRARIEESAP